MGKITEFITKKILKKKPYGRFTYGDILVLTKEAFQGVVYRTSVITEMGYYAEVDIYHGDLFIVINDKNRPIKKGQVPVMHFNSGIELVFNAKFFEKAGKIYQVLYGD